MTTQMDASRLPQQAEVAETVDPMQKAMEIFQGEGELNEEVQPELNNHVGEPEKVAEEQVEAKNPATELISKRLAHLEKKQRELFLREKRLKDLEGKTQVSPEILEQLPEIQEMLKLKKRAKYDPMKWLEAAGLSYDEITKYHLNGGNASMTPELEDALEKIKAQESKLSEWEKKQQELEMQSTYQREIDSLKAQVTADTAPFVASSGRYDLVLNVMNGLREQGEEATLEDATARVESYLKDNMKREAEAIKSNPKVLEYVKELLGLAQSTQSMQNGLSAENAGHSQHKPIKTLTNSMQQAVVRQQGPMTEEQKRALALEILEKGEV